jgi:hypothetical protein
MTFLFDFSQELIILIALAIVFLQSAIDKIADRKGNLDFLKSHFSNSILTDMVPLLLSTITLVEFSVGLLSLYAIFEISFLGTKVYGFYACVLSAISLLMLLFGQRLAKDYAGAQTIIIYLIFTVVGIGVMA